MAIKIALGVCLAIAATTVAGCNSYPQTCSGERGSAVSRRSVTMQQPSPRAAHLIGHSTFVGTDDEIGDTQGTDSRRQVSSNLVDWDHADKGSITQLESVPVHSGWSWHSDFNQVGIPLPAQPSGAGTPTGT